jgi:hypothetical protein
VNAVRNAVNSVRYEWLGARIGGPDASIRGQWLTLIASAVFVFACFFAIGHVRAGGGSSGGGSSASPAYAAEAPIPEGLRGGSPIAGAVPSAIATPPRPQPVKVAAAPAGGGAPAAPAQLLAAEARQAFAPRVEPRAASVPQAAPQPTPSEAPAPSGGHSGSAGKGSGGGSTGGQSGGGSFDSSE